MKREDMPSVDRPFYEVCECNHTKVSHGRGGGSCLYYRCPCARFRFSHYDDQGIQEFLDSH